MPILIKHENYMEVSMDRLKNFLPITAIYLVKTYLSLGMTGEKISASPSHF